MHLQQFSADMPEKISWYLEFKFVNCHDFR